MITAILSGPEHIFRLGGHLLKEGPFLLRNRARVYESIGPLVKGPTAIDLGTESTPTTIPEDLESSKESNPC